MVAPKIAHPSARQSELVPEPGALPLGVLAGGDHEVQRGGLQIARAVDVGAKLAHANRLHDRQRRIEPALVEGANLDRRFHVRSCAGSAGPITGRAASAGGNSTSVTNSRPAGGAVCC